MKKFFCLMLVIVSLACLLSSCGKEWDSFGLLGVKIEAEKDIYSLGEGHHLVMCKNKEMAEKMNVKKFLISVDVSEHGTMTISTPSLGEEDDMKENGVSEKAVYLFSEFRSFKRIGAVWHEENSPLLH